MLQLFVQEFLGKHFGKSEDKLDCFEELWMTPTNDRFLLFGSPGYDVEKLLCLLLNAATAYNQSEDL
jgi:hypothetical protein